jgi:tetratricopeptide (TPR) repeat protein
MSLAFAFQAAAVICFFLSSACFAYLSLTFTKKQRHDISWLRNLNGKKLLAFSLGVLCGLVGVGLEIAYYYRNPPLLSLRTGPRDQGFVATTSYVFDDELRSAPEALRNKTRDAYVGAEIAYVAGQYREAERQYKQSIDYFPTLSAYLGLGISQEAESHYRDSEASFQAGMALQDKSNGPILTGEFLANSARTLLDEGRSRDSEEAANRAVDISGRSGRSITRAIALTILGNIYAYRGKTDTARDEYNSALGIYSDLHDHLGMGIIFDDLASLYLDRSDKEKVKSYTNKARSEFLNSNNNLLGSANADIIEGTLYSQSGTADKDAIRYFSDAKSKADSISNEYLSAVATDYLADLYRIRGNYKDASPAATGALNKFASLDAPNGQGIALLCLGNIAAFQNHNEEALDFFRRAETAFSAAGNDLGYISATGNEAEILRAIGKFSEAGTVNEEILAAFRDIGNKEGEENTLLSLGNIYLEQKNPLPLESLKEYRAALSIANENGDQGYIAKAHASIGNSLMMLAKYSQAEKEIQQALSLYDHVDDPRSKTTTIIMLGELRLKERKYCDARSLFDQAMATAVKLGYAELASSIAEDQKLLGGFCRASAN